MATVDDDESLPDREGGIGQGDGMRSRVAPQTGEAITPGRRSAVDLDCGQCASGEALHDLNGQDAGRQKGHRQGMRHGIPILGYSGGGLEDRDGVSQSESWGELEDAMPGFLRLMLAKMVCTLWRLTDRSSSRRAVPD